MLSSSIKKENYFVNAVKMQKKLVYSALYESIKNRTSKNEVQF